MQGPRSTGDSSTGINYADGEPICTTNSEATSNSMLNPVDVQFPNNSTGSGRPTYASSSSHVVQNHNWWGFGESSSRLGPSDQVNTIGSKPDRQLPSDGYGFEEGQSGSNSMMLPGAVQTGSHTRNGPSFLRGSSSNHMLGHVNLGKDMDISGSGLQTLGSSSQSAEERTSGPGSSLGGLGSSCKRKALEGAPSHSFPSESHGCFFQTENGAWNEGPAQYDASSSLSLSMPSQNSANATNQSGLPEPRSGIAGGRAIAASAFPSTRSTETLSRPGRRLNPGHAGKNSACRKKFMAIKTDMSKAYDRIEWQFLRALMAKMGFARNWIDRIMFCISSVSYKVLLNGSPRGKIIPTRGIRQGDPISPFLFILCTEALVAQLNAAEWNGKIQGLQVSKASPSTSHLLFADDSLFFCKAEESQGKAIVDIIRCYGEASGQLLNARKSSVMFGMEVDSLTRNTIKETLGIHNEGGMGTYLGLPEKIHGSKTQVFAFVRDRLQSRINTWSAKFLSKGGKEVLIKSVAQALPTYVMSCFLLPETIRSKLSSAIADFWWRSNPESKGLHWIAWEKLCTQSADGGLGFRTLEEFNLALLAKQLWRLIKFPNSLLSRVLRGRYYRYSDPLQVQKSNRPSYGWRSIMAAKPLLVSGLRRTIGSGMNTRVWLDPWIPDIPARPAKNRVAERDPHLYVDFFIDRNTKQWNLDRLREFVDPTDIPLILGMRPSRSYLSDGYSWNGTKSGNYTVKSGYWAARDLSRPTCDHPFQGPGITPLLAQVWKIKTTRKLKHFVWQCLSGCLATNQALFYRHIGKEKSCPRCGADEETVNHILFECPPALQTWALSPFPSAPSFFPCQSLFSNLDFLFWRAKGVMTDEDQIHVFPWILWFLWKARNRFIFDNVRESPQDILDHATSEASDWRLANQKEDSPIDSPDGTNNLPSGRVSLTECQIDGSWSATDTLSGHGWVVLDRDAPVLVGLKSSRRGLSPLQAEFDSLLWAMDCLITASKTDISFATDCLELISILEDPSEWSTFAVEIQTFKLLKTSFPSFSIRHIPRCNNTFADCLAKKARTRGFIFTHVSTSVPDWLSISECPQPIA